ncbi:MAG: acyltransferase [Pirellulales bacterium]
MPSSVASQPPPAAPESAEDAARTVSANISTETAPQRPAPTKPVLERITELDLLRFVAAISVVLFHYAFRGYAANDMTTMPHPELAPIAKYGHLGVQLFFMISGFVILMSAAGGSLRQFVVSRIVRLYPAFWICCTITFLFTLAIGGDRYVASWKQFLVNLTMLSNFAQVPSIDGVYWSLFLELRFYGLIALVLLLGQMHRIQEILIGWLVVSALVEWSPVRGINWLLFTDYSAFFIAGAMLYLIWSRGSTPLRFGVVLACWIFCEVQSIRGARALSQQFHTNYDEIVVTLIVTSCFVAMTLVALRVTRGLGHSRWIMLGAITYPLYLLHQHIGFMVMNLAHPTFHRHVILGGLVLTMIAASLAIHVWLERPLSKLLKSMLNVVRI